MVLGRHDGVVQRKFVLFSNYKPTVENITALLLDEDGKPVSRVKLDNSRTYYVSGFDFKGNVVLHDKQFGVKYLIPGNADQDFASASNFPSSATFGLSGSAATLWKPQIFEKGCWLAAMAVLAGKDQKTIQTELNWPDDAFYSITMKELPEFGGMIKCPVKSVDYKNIDSLCDAVNHSPVILGVPNHVVVLYAITTDKKTICLWDPATGMISYKNWLSYKDFIDSAYCKK